MIDFDNVPDFMLERAIKHLETLHSSIDYEISELRHQVVVRDLKKNEKKRKKRIFNELVERGFTERQVENFFLQEKGLPINYSRETLHSIRMRKKYAEQACRDLEIFRLWHVEKKKKTALARDFGLSRSTVERICKKMIDNADDFKENPVYRQIIFKAKAKKSKKIIQ